ncbi:transglycosylase domain-containing protein [Tengunoibacter tsumagoiensis]|uniref:Uncharacterized protein n=1 Tax=Tengunoibacter tsumagoiensis TaxID=2014871 RepID=A0A401ZWX3_9CHLR|nr:transglycosylase domain-containing protein [Tengunoibacter tsumagoiensis]GCE11358.1 hypothetical protein KTT_12170 [Tengunoibacter tsumagoiensis]
MSNWSEPPQPPYEEKQLPFENNPYKGEIAPIPQGSQAVNPVQTGPQGSSVPSPIPARPRGQGGLHPQDPAKLVTNTLDLMRRWSGKMAAVAGYQPDAVEPPRERYHPPAPRPSSVQNSQPAGHLARRRWRRSRTTRIVHQMRHRRHRWQGRRQSVTARVWLALGIAVIVLFSFSGGGAGAYGYNYYQSQLPQMERLANSQISQTTHIYDRNGVLLYDSYDDLYGRRTPVAYKDLPRVLQDAMTSTEDKTFWSNYGLDPLGTIRAYADNSGGGSGLAQQLIKQLSHNDAPTYQRKITEAAMAIGLTQQFSKAKIMEMYFNVVPFGNHDLGVESAVEEYFHLMPQCDAAFNCVPGVARLDYESDANPHNPVLALARASLLAGMPQKPGYNDPTVNKDAKERALARQKDVLNLMMVNGVEYKPGKLITPAIAKQAEDLTAQMTFVPYQKLGLAPYFVDWVISQIEQSLGPDGATIFTNGGFNVRTTIDINLEKYVEDAVKRHLTQPEYQQFQGGRYLTLNTDDNVNNAAVVVMNSKTGEILAMDGSLDRNSTDVRVGGLINMATSPRQPGSTFKPIVYSTSFEMGWYPGIVLPDIETYFPNKLGPGAPVPLTQAQKDKQDPDYAWAPPDYMQSYHSYINPMTIRTATANSFNVPAVKALQFVGLDNAVNTAERMGLETALKKDALAHNCASPTLSECFSMPFVLGTAGVPLLDMTGAYQVFANQGSRIPPQGVLDIYDNYGHHLYHYDAPGAKGDQVMSPQVSYMMTSVLSDEYARHYEFAGDSDLSFTDHDRACGYQHSPNNYQGCTYQVAAKTGTTDGFVDNWTIGYTPNLVVGVWAGNTNAEPMNQGVVGITGAAPIWHSVMEFAANGWCNTDTDQIPCPQNVNRAGWNLGSATQFAQPDGLVCAPSSGYNGLQGSAGTCDWMLAGQQPQQAGTPPARN